MIVYVTGDATEPVGDGQIILAHIVNRGGITIGTTVVPGGIWGAGFVMALSARWPQPEARYRSWAKAASPRLPLGGVQFVAVDEWITVANMVAQYAPNEGVSPPIDYDALGRCLERVAERAARTSGSVHMPKIGSGLAGGKWETIEGIINEQLVGRGLRVYVYELPGREGAR